MSTLKENGTEQEQVNLYQEEDQPELDFTTAWELFEEVQDKLNKEYKFIPSPDGVFSCLDIYYKAKLEIAGLNIPKDFFYYKKLTTQDRAYYAQFRARVQNVLSMLAQGSKHRAKLAGTIISALFGKVGDTRSEIAMQAYSRIGDASPVRTLSGLPGCMKIVPQVYWFPEEVQQLDPLSMLSIFDRVEAEVLMLILGKALVGYDGCITAEGRVNTSARAYAIMVDTEGGLGKSRLMTYVREAMTKLGFKVTSVNTNGSRFGWGTIALSDLALIDDLTNDKLGHVVSSNDIKQLVTNGTFRTEEKGLPSVEVRSVTTILGASNTTDPRHFFSMDGGSIARLNQLRTKTVPELIDEYGSFDKGALPEYLQGIADRLNTTVEVLTMYLLARSAEMFLTYTGNDIVEGQLTKTDDVLMHRMNELRANLKIDPNFTYVDDLTQALAVFAAIAYVRGHDGVTKNDFKAVTRNLKMTPDVVTSFINYYGLELPGELQQICRPKTLDIASVEYAQVKVRELENQKSTKKYLEAFANAIDELSSTRGFKYPTALSFYESSWSKAKEQAIVHFQAIEEATYSASLNGALYNASQKIFK